eukprot:scaffold67160_cov28-Tisochrysis_lutea.AAC.5
MAHTLGTAQAGVAIETGANPTLLRNRIFNGKQSGVFCFDKGLGHFVENDIYNNLEAGVQVRTTAVLAPTTPAPEIPPDK